MYLKRQKIKKFWPVSKKGTKYLAVATHEKSKAIPLIIVMREVLGLVKNRKELQKLLNEKKVLINNKKIRDFRYPVILFDNLSFPKIKKHYKAVLKNKKFCLEEISEKEAGTRIYKVESKKSLKNKKVQLNLSNGKNILSSEKINVGDFVTINLSDNKITKIESLKSGINVIVIRGKHIGIIGKIKEIREEGHKKIAFGL